MSKYDEIMEHIVVTPEMRTRILAKLDGQVKAGGKARTEPLRFAGYRKSFFAAACLAVFVLGTVTFSRMYPEMAERFGAGGRDGFVPELSGETLEMAAAGTETTAAAEGSVMEEAVVGEAAFAPDSAPLAALPGEPAQGGSAQPDLVQEEPAAGIPSPLKEAADAAQLSERLGFPVHDLEPLPFAVTETTYLTIADSLAEIIYKGEGCSVTYRKARGAEDISGDYQVYENEKQAAVGELTVTLKGNSGLWNLALWNSGEFSWSVMALEGLREEEILALVQAAD